MTSTNGSANRRSVPIEHIEALLRSLEGVRAATVQADPNGSIRTIHVVADDEFTPGQVARNVQSALVARFGLLVDHRSVDVRSHPEDPPADTAAPTDGAAAPRTAPVTAQPSAPAAGPGLGPDTRILSLELERLHPHRIRCRLTLDLPGGARSGEAEQLDRADARLEVAARATLAAVQAAGHGPALELDGIQRVTLAGSTYILAAVRIAAGRTMQRAAGAAPLDDVPEDAAVYAVLQAVQTRATPPTAHDAVARIAL